MQEVYIVESFILEVINLSHQRVILDRRVFKVSLELLAELLLVHDGVDSAWIAVILGKLSEVLVSHGVTLDILALLATTVDHVGHLERLTVLGLHALVSILPKGHARGGSSCSSLQVLGRSVLDGSLVRHLDRLLSSGSSCASLLGGVGASLLDGVLLGRVDAEEPVGGV